MGPDLRRLDVPPTQIELDNRHEPLDGVINIGHRKESLGMRHETGFG